MIESTASTRGFIGYAPGMEAEIRRFLRKAWPNRDAELMWRRWEWQYLASAQRLCVDPMVCMYRREGIVAHQGIIPAKVKIGAAERVTGWFVETMVLEAVRGKTIGPMLIRKALEALPFNLSLGQTEVMRSIQFALGWKEIGSLKTFIYPLRPNAILREKVKNPLGRVVAATALTAASRTRRLWAAPARDKSVTLERIERYDRRFDHFWRRISADRMCCLVRDSSFMNWKFVDQPGQDFLRLCVCRNGEITAAAVVAFRTADNVYPYNRAFIMELLLPQNDTPAAVQMLCEIERACIDQQADAVLIDVSDAHTERLLKKLGFILRAPQRRFLVSPGDLPADEWALVRTMGHWFLTRADSDIDRPWNSSDNNGPPAGKTEVMGECGKVQRTPS